MLIEQDLACTTTDERRSCHIYLHVTRHSVHPFIALISIRSTPINPKPHNLNL